MNLRHANHMILGHAARDVLSGVLSGMLPVAPVSVVLTWHAVTGAPLH